MSSFLVALGRATDSGIGALQARLGQWEPLKLAAAGSNIRDQCGNSAIDFARADWFDSSLTSFLSSDASTLRTLDHLVLAYGLYQESQKLDERSLLKSAEWLAQLLSEWTRIAKGGQDANAVLIWRGVLLSVFKCDRDDIGLPMALKFLADTWPCIKTTEPSPSWIKAFDRHRSLLERSPVRLYAAEWMAGNQKRTQELASTVDIPSNSWFWADLLGAVRDLVCNEKSDSKFQAGIALALDMRTQHVAAKRDVSLSEEVLGSIVSRYSESTNTPRHEVLLAELLSAWGSPQLNLAASQHKWSAATDAARLMVCGWLAEEDLRDFDELCRREAQVDGRRLKYWLRFKEQITFSRLVLGDTMRYSRDLDIRTFRERKLGRLAWLTPQPSAENNAIILRIGDWWLIEFSETGNACYPYAAAKAKFQPGKTTFSIHDLKSSQAVAASGAATLIHTNRDWEARFDAFLAQRGILPDKGARQAVRSTSESILPTTRVDVPIKWPKGVEIPRNAIDELEKLGARAIDNRGKGGNYWLEVDDPADTLKIAMKVFGFGYVENRGFYLKKK